MRLPSPDGKLAWEGLRLLNILEMGRVVTSPSLPDTSLGCVMAEDAPTWLWTLMPAQP